jgi:hypothetical protein
MENNKKLIEKISAIKLAFDTNQNGKLNSHFLELKDLLDKPNMNFNEFTSFFPSMDVSFSIYSNLSSDEKIEFLEIAVKKFIEKRHSIYTAHGYSPITLQVRKDFENHKTKGSSAKKKVESLLIKNGYKELKTGESIINNPLKYHFIGTSQNTVALLNDLRLNLKLKFQWQSVHQNKSADVAFSDAKGNIYISELKHLKETGGGQDKQVAELISLISFCEDSEKIRYLSYLDGIYFNSFIKPTAPKTIAQVDQIKNYLKDYPQNFFVNTFGLIQILCNKVSVN